jgi:apolipoprotein D and lipocalin family protein
MTVTNKNILIGSAAVAVAATAALLSACSSTIPKGASAVKPFDLKRYSGKWYEIARLDFKYEKGLNNTTANYSLNENGTIAVINRGYDPKKQKWKEAKGKAKFVDSPDEARLKVSFFGPFYSGYNVIAIDPGYRYALVAGEDLKYLWLLSREKDMPDDVKQAYVNKAKDVGYNTDDLVWVKHDRNQN